MLVSFIFNGLRSKIHINIGIFSPYRRLCLMQIKFYFSSSLVSIYCCCGCVPVQSPKYTPPIEFVDQAALSPPEGYKDGGANLQQALGGALGGHIFGAQHIQQLQVIQRLQAQRAAMLAARATAAGGNPNQSSGSINNNSRSSQSPVPQVPSSVPASNTICTECAECSECAAKQEHDDGMYYIFESSLLLSSSLFTATA